MNGFNPTLTLNNGVEMPALGLGVYQSAPEETTGAVQIALELGYRLVDTAAVYCNEREVGEGIRRAAVDRSEIFLTTKLWIADFGYDEALAAFDASLRRLNTDYVDLYLLHWPMPTKFEQTIGAYQAAEKILADGKARAIGVSNFDPEHTLELGKHTSIVPALNQVELHPYFTQKPLEAFNTERGIITQAWSPIGGINVYHTDDPALQKNVLLDPVVVDIAKEHNKTAAQVVIRWHLQRGRSAIPKSVKAHRIAENFDVFDFELSDEELTRIDDLNTGVRGGPTPQEVDTDKFTFKVPND